MLLGAYSVIDTFSLRPFYNILFIFSAKAMYLPKRMIVTYVTVPSMALKTPKRFLHRRPPMRTLKRVDKSEYSDNNPAKSDINTANGKENGETNDLVGAVHYKRSTDREL